MATPLKTGLPLGLELGAAYTLRFDALDPTTGATVSGVTVSQASVLTETGEAVVLEPKQENAYVYQGAGGDQVVNVK